MEEEDSEVIAFPLLSSGPLSSNFIHLDLLLEFLQGLDQLTVVLVGMVQLDLHFIQVCLHLLFQPQGLGSPFGLQFQARLQSLDGPLVVLPTEVSKRWWSGSKNQERYIEVLLSVLLYCSPPLDRLLPN